MKAFLGKYVDAPDPIAFVIAMYGAITGTWGFAAMGVALMTFFEVRKIRTQIIKAIRRDSLTVAHYVKEGNK